MKVGNDKTVAIVSNNNAATANVLEKLQKYGLDFIAVYLGNKDNKEKFFAEQTQAYPSMITWAMDATGYKAIKEALELSGKELEEMLEVKNMASVLKQELSALAVEKEYFDKYYFTAFELIFERISRAFDGGLVQNGDYHRELLRSMTLEIPDLRPRIISKDLAEELDE